MAKRKKRYTQEEIDLVTVLHTELSKPQADIAKELRWTTSKVCRVLKIAREDQNLWREESVRTIVDPALASRAQIIVAKYEGQKWEHYKLLIEWLKQLDTNGHLRDAHIFRSDRKPLSDEIANSTSVWDRSAIQFGKQAAPLIHQRLSRVKCCGVSWGRTLRAIVSKLVDMKSPRPWSEQGTKFFPLWGEVPAEAEVGSDIFTVARDLGSTKLAEDLHDLANGVLKMDFSVPDLRASLAMMPVEPFAMDPNMHKTVVKLMKCNRNYCRVIDELIPSMDAALLSVGSFKQQGRALSGSVLECSGVADEIMAMYDGDIGGVLMETFKVTASTLEYKSDGKKAARTKAPAKDKRKEAIRLAWLGVRFEDLFACAEKAAENPSNIGTLVCAVGGERAETLVAGIKAGLCTEVFIDDDLAEALERMRKDFFR